MLHDLRLALRGLVRAPLASILAITCLALGIGTNATMFSVVSTTLIDSLPFRDSSHLVTVRSTQPEGGVRRGNVSFPDLRDYQEQATAFESLSGLQSRSLTFSDTDEPERVQGAAVSWRLFSMLGVAPALGRDFTESDDRPGAAPVVILSDELWRRRYNADSGIIGRALMVNARPHTVIGVLPPRVKFPFQEVAWVPLVPLAGEQPRQARDLQVFARISPDRTLEQARESLVGVAARLAGQYPENAGWSVLVNPLTEYYMPGEPRLFVLTAMGAVTLVLLIACANVANLLLARATARAREMSVRAAVGAGRGRIVRQLITESVVLGLVSGPIGIALAYAGVGSVRAGVQADDIPYVIHFEVDGRTLLYTLLISIATGIVFGLAPALHAARGDLVSALREGGRTGEGSARNRARYALVIAEVAVSIVLLVGAALFVRSFLQLQRADAGFDTRPITTARIYMPAETHAEPDSRLHRVDDILHRLEGTPGILAAGASNLIPLDGGGTTTRIRVPGKNFDAGREPRLFYAGVTAHYLDALGATLLRGRGLTEQESATRSRVAVVNVSMARTLLASAEENAALPRLSPNRLAGARELDRLDPIGRQFTMLQDPDAETFTVIGVIGDVMTEEIAANEVTPAAFVSYAYQQTPNTGLIVRTAAIDAPALTPAIRAAVRASDPGIPIFAASSMDEIRRLGFWQFQLFGQMFAVFGGLAVVLAIVGVYGVLSYSVSQRTQEFGVRMALGAEPRDVRGMMMRQGVMLAVWGILLGVAGAFGITRVIGSLLYNVTPTDPVSFGGVVLLMLLVAAVAAYLPARRATLVDPLVALRAE
ncbi:MAG TPA: ABC transporter permease [Vicinamibacterales bacterium]|nr:ABC transporter permease [Vicinamibacterales bacterium]